MAQKRSQNNSRRQSSQSKGRSQSRPAQNAPADMSARMDIAGVLITALGIALFVAVLSKSTGVATNAL